MSGLLNIVDSELAQICVRYRIRRLAVFGSLLTGAARPDSDIDLLVEFEAGLEPGLLGMSHIEIELGQLLGRKVDLRTAEDLSPYFRDDVLRNAKIAYAS